VGPGITSSSNGYPERCLHFFATEQGGEWTSSTVIPEQSGSATENSALSGGNSGDISADTTETFARLQPFSTQIDPLSRAAAEDLKRSLKYDSTADRKLPAGKMYGVLVVKWRGGFAYLAAYSGKLHGKWLHDGFVPPPFDVEKTNRVLDTADVTIKALQSRIRKQKLDESIDLYGLQLEELKTKFDFAHNTMKKRHEERKIARHKLRAELDHELYHKLSNPLLAACGPIQIEKDLAGESQADRRDRKTLRREFEKTRVKLTEQLSFLSEKKQALQDKCRLISQQAQKTYFSLFYIQNHKGHPVDLLDLGEGKLPPAGTGECAGAKLLAFAYKFGLEPVSMAEFWWGESTSGQIRHHGSYYPACRGKCGLLLPQMLPNDNLTSSFGHREHLESRDNADHSIRIVYEDESMAVVDKPAGLLSVPGKLVLPCVLDWARSKWPEADGPLLVHRLDMDTSGLLLIAKTAKVHRVIQQQFEQRTIEKIYDALVERIPGNRMAASGTVNLPLRVDLDDRPRQLVCHAHGKPAVTHWKVAGVGFWSLVKGYVETDFQVGSATGDVPTKDNDLQNRDWDGKAIMRIELRPVTGRTHQLRVHSGSSLGLNSPIVGDPLYGKTPTSRITAVKRQGGNNFQTPQRMMLHARSLSLVHPTSGKPLMVVANAPFLNDCFS